jgi:hypothetical protein
MEVLAAEFRLESRRRGLRFTPKAVIVTPALYRQFKRELNPQPGMGMLLKFRDIPVFIDSEYEGDGVFVTRFSYENLFQRRPVAPPAARSALPDMPAVDVCFDL